VENPGKYRKVGPALRHVNTKTTQGWLEFWTNKPQEFRPSTRMPQFFHLTNQEDELAEAYQPVQIAAVSHYLLDKSQEVELLSPPEGYQPDAERGKKLFAERGCLGCHTHKDFPEIQKDFGPNLDKVYAKLKPGEDGFKWLYSWIQDPQRYHKRSKMPNLYIQDNPPQTENGPADPAADIAAYLLKDRDTTSVDYKPYDVKSATITLEEEEQSVLDALVELNLAQSLTKAQIEELEKTRVYPVKPEFIKGDEIELVHAGEGAPSEADWHSMKLNYLGRRTITQYGCYGCHDIPNFEAAKPIGVALQDWGRKDTSRLAFEHIEEFLHHHSAPGSSTTLTQQVEVAVKAARADEFKTEKEADEELSKAFYYDSILHHGRPGFIWQKLRQPRSYDYKKTETKRYDERLKMPRFPFNSQQIEAVATFVLGLTAEPPAEKYVYQPQGAARSRYEGEALLAKYNCTSCHMVELPEAHYAVNPRQTREDVLAWIVENREAITTGEMGRDKYPPYQRQIDDHARKHAKTTLKDLVSSANAQANGDDAELELVLNEWFDEHPNVLAPTYADFTAVGYSVGMTLDQIIDWFVENREGLVDGSLGTYPEYITKIQTLS
jgi:cytochrome c551/c552